MKWKLFYVSNSEIDSINWFCNLALSSWFDKNIFEDEMKLVKTMNNFAEAGE